MSVLSSLRIIEIEGIGPAPFCGMHLADLGADVILVERPRKYQSSQNDAGSIIKRGKRVVRLDLKCDEGVEAVKNLVQKADGLIEGMRPGVMERLGLGPAICHAINPKLVYGRVTGWGQTGPLSHAAGHDNNYTALSGALWYASPAGQPPVAPPTLIGDVASGALYLTIGMLAAIHKAAKTGNGDIVDAAMVDGSAHMMNLLLSAQASGIMQEQRGASLLDGPHWFETYQTKDGKYITLGSLEPQFYVLLLDKLDLEDDPEFSNQFDIKRWPDLKIKLGSLIKSKTRNQWREILEGTDACFAPVLSPNEAANHPHMQARDAYYKHEGQLEAAPAPRFASGTNSFLRRNHTELSLAEALDSWS